MAAKVSSHVVIVLLWLFMMEGKKGFCCAAMSIDRRFVNI